jgi:hypothetical protein
MEICTFHVQSLVWYFLVSCNFAAIQLFLGKLNHVEMCYYQVWTVSCSCMFCSIICTLKTVSTSLAEAGRNMRPISSFS